MLTNFGKICKKIRIDNNQVLYDMASVLGVNSSFLSTVENGKKNVPQGWCEKIRDEYQLNTEQYQELLEAKEMSVTQVKLDIKGYELEQRNLVVSFARSFETLSEEQREKIMSILNE